jgi:hypothetical protein
MATIIHRNIDWFARANIPHRFYLYVNAQATLGMRNGALYYAARTVDRRPGHPEWDVYLFKAPGDGSIVLWHHFREGVDFKGHASTVSLAEQFGGPLDGKLLVTIGSDDIAQQGGQSALYHGRSTIVEP